MQLNTTFSITATINPETKEHFGAKYAGTFSIRRPTLQDKTNIALRCAAEMSVAGGVGLDLVTDEILNANYVFSQMEVIKTSALPEWFDKSKIYEEDEPAVKAVSKAVSDFLDTFRSQNNSGAGTAGSKDAPVVVSAEV
jgi:hypothetical protein